MSVLDDLGLSADEWRQLEPTQQQKLVMGQARLMANQQLIGQAAVEDDDRDIRRRAAAVQRDILGSDANACEDVPLEDEADNDVRVTVLGDVNSDRALKWLNPQSAAVTFPWLLTALATLGILLALTIGGLALWAALKKPDIDPADPNTYQILAIDQYQKGDSK